MPDVVTSRAGSELSPCHRIFWGRKKGRGRRRPVSRPTGQDLGRRPPCAGASVPLMTPSLSAGRHPLQPEGHFHVAVHGRGRRELLLCLLPLPQALGELAEAEVAVGQEGRIPSSSASASARR